MPPPSGIASSKTQHIAMLLQTDMHSPRRMSSAHGKENLRWAANLSTLFNLKCAQNWGSGAARSALLQNALQYWRPCDMLPTLLTYLPPARPAGSCTDLHPNSTMCTLLHAGLCPSQCHCNRSRQPPCCQSCLTCAGRQPPKPLAMPYQALAPSQRTAPGATPCCGLPAHQQRPSLGV